MYILTQMLWMFPIYSLLGWCLEVVYCAVTTGKLVNRGFFGGFICPIYGLGASLMILLLAAESHNLLLLFFGTLILGSLLELVGGFLLKRLFRIRWWDYSDEPLNIGGYICLKFSLMWGVSGILLLKIIHPPIADLIRITPPALLTTLLILFYIYFAADLITTVLSALKLSRDLREITRLSALIQKSGERLAKGIGTPAIEAAQKIESLEVGHKAREISERVQTAAEYGRVKFRAKVEDSERLNALLSNAGSIRRRLFRAFPNMRAFENSSALAEMRRRVKGRTQRKKRDADNE